MSRVVRAIFLFLLAVPCCAFAQDAARVEVFGGYQYFHANSGFDVPGVDSFSMNGWNAAVSGFLNKHLGATADFAGVYGTPSVSGIGVDTKLYTFLFGPVNGDEIAPAGAHARARVRMGKCQLTAAPAAKYAGWHSPGRQRLEFIRIQTSQRNTSRRLRDPVAARSRGDG